MNNQAPEGALRVAAQAVLDSFDRASKEQYDELAWSELDGAAFESMRAALAAPAPQAAPVPLTDDTLLDGFCKARHSQHYASVFIAGARFAELAHGIPVSKEPKA